jgi:hypothetical protein
MRTFGTQAATAAAMRPFHEAMSRRTRRARHSWQVFGLAGMHRVVLRPVDDAAQNGPLRSRAGFLVAIASQSG